MKVFFYFISVFLASCTNKIPYESNKFYNDASIIFKDYKYDIVYGRTNSQFTSLDLIVNKSNIQLSNLKKLQYEILKRGWVYNYDIDGYYWSYCKDNSESLRILFPDKKIVKTRDGTYFSSDLNPDTVYIWMRDYKSNEMNKEHAECGK